LWGGRSCHTALSSQGYRDYQVSHFFFFLLCYGCGEGGHVRRNCPHKDTLITRWFIFFLFAIVFFSILRFICLWGGRSCQTRLSSQGYRDYQVSHLSSIIAFLLIFGSCCVVLCLWGGRSCETTMSSQGYFDYQVIIHTLFCFDIISFLLCCAVPVGGRSEDNLITR